LDLEQNSSFNAGKGDLIEVHAEVNEHGSQTHTPMKSELKLYTLSGTRT